MSPETWLGISVLSSWAVIFLQNSEIRALNRRVAELEKRK